MRFENRLQDDLVIARGDGSAVYNFAVAVDDLDMGITDVIRGDDHLSNTPKQLRVLEALGATPPRYAHLPLLHGPDGKKLSKRHGAASVQELRDAGYLPAAVRNYLALLGWGTDDDTTLLSTEELVERFEIERVGTASAIFDEKKLRWMNGRFMREMPLDEYRRRARGSPGGRSAAASPTSAARGLRDRPGEGPDPGGGLAAGPRSCSSRPADDDAAWEKVMKPEAKPLLEAALEALARAASPSTPRRSRRPSRAVLERTGVKPKAVYQPLRVAITGGTVSPGIFESLAVLGKERSIERIEAANRTPGLGLRAKAAALAIR